MKIAQVAPLYEAVPPKFYGGTERVVHYLTEELVSLGHDVTLFASGDSQTSAKLVAHVPEALRLNKSCEDSLAPHIVQLEEVVEMANEFDIIHFHTDYLHFPFTRKLFTAHVTTLHGKLTIPELQLIYNKFPDQPVVSISKNQQKPLPQANWISTIYHGLPVNLHKAGNGLGGYLAFLGRISPEKGLDKAISVAKSVGIKIKIAAKIDKADEEYYEEKIKPLLNHPLIEFIGEINEAQKTEFLGNAMALLFLINWEEPFGIVTIEAMACGTPVIAFEQGSVPEVIENGKSGFVVQTEEQAIEAVKQIPLLNRKTVRECFEKRFTSRRMATNYLEVYQRLQKQMKSKENLLVALQDRKLSII
jgi:glycosyltransferase involved in cell wall biosynthesis